MNIKAYQLDAKQASAHKLEVIDFKELRLYSKVYQALKSNKAPKTEVWVIESETQFEFNKVVYRNICNLLRTGNPVVFDGTHLYPTEIDEDLFMKISQNNYSAIWLPEDTKAWLNYQLNMSNGYRSFCANQAYDEMVFKWRHYFSVNLIRKIWNTPEDELSRYIQMFGSPADADSISYLTPVKEINPDPDTGWKNTYNEGDRWAQAEFESSISRQPSYIAERHIALVELFLHTYWIVCKYGNELIPEPDQVSNIVCPECGAIISAKTGFCPFCYWENPHTAERCFEDAYAFEYDDLDSEYYESESEEEDAITEYEEDNEEVEDDE